MADPDMPNVGEVVQFPSHKDFATSGVYFLHLNGEVVYVGQSCDMWCRIGQHMEEGKKIFDAVSCFRCLPSQLLKWERYFIAQFVPRLNQCNATKSIRGDAATKFLAKQEPHIWVGLKEAAKILGPSCKILGKRKARQAVRELREMGLICRRIPRSRDIVFSLQSLKKFASIPTSAAID